VRNACVEELTADHREAVPLVKRCGLHLCAEPLLFEVASFRLGDHRLQQCIADAQSAPVAKHRDATDVAVGEQSGGADSIVAVEGEEVDRCGILGIPLQFRRHRLFGDEYGFTDAPQLCVVLLPVGNADMDVSHWRTPGCPV